ncbi:MAG: hypothetical protein ACD_28C00379G0013 [uncultured bacterium]|nr:MAG: hypothetical protein ACD_28C00379G0013 [uncultured bacterium]
MTSTALFIGRFQPFHEGHLSVVKRALRDNDFLLIGIGSAEEDYLPDNPFTAGERWEMIRAALDEAHISKDRYAILPVRNINHYSLWVEHVATLLPSFQVVYTGSPIVKELFMRHGVYEIKEVDFKVKISAKEIRKTMKEGGNWKKHLSASVSEKIKDLRGIERIQSIAESLENPS